MAREKYQTLTEQMYYILISLMEECCGVDIMEKVKTITSDRISVGPGTLYTLLGNFEKAGMIEETRVEGRKRSYRITPFGKEVLEVEVQRLQTQVTDFHKLLNEGRDTNDRK